MAKKYYWLKLKDDFFDQKQIKFLRKLPDGDKLVIVYLKMQLTSIKAEGVIKYDKILPSNVEELALILDEDINIVKLTLSALEKMGLIEILDDGSFFMLAVMDLIGKESESAERVRKYRALQCNDKALQCNNDVTECNTEIEIEIDIEKREEKEIEKDIEIKTEPEKKKSTSFQRPTLNEVKAYCEERGNNIDPEKFIDYYNSNGWKVGKSPMKDWKATIRNWERNDKERNKPKNMQDPDKLFF